MLTHKTTLPINHLPKTDKTLIKRLTIIIICNTSETIFKLKLSKLLLSGHKIILLKSINFMPEQ